MDLKHTFICTLLFVSISNEKLENVKICVVGNTKDKFGHTTKYCDLLARSKRTPVTCVYAGDRAECLRMVSSRKADFTVMEPEDLIFSMLWQDSALLVVSEIRAMKEDRYKFGNVVVLRNNLNMTSMNLKGKKLCHPGLKSGLNWNDLFAQYFEEREAPRNCEPGLTVFEDRIKTSSNFFGDSCKAGPWVIDEDEDARLKGKYSSMCAICESGDCSNSEKYRGSGGSILCLTDGVGDILWARYDDLKIFFKKFGTEIFPTDYSLLCEDGTLKPINDNDPCLWLAMPWQTIGANRKSANDVQKLFHQFGTGEWKNIFMEAFEAYTIFEPSYVLAICFLQHEIVNLNVPKTPEDYLALIPGYLSAIETAQGNCNPKHSVRLCTTSPIEQKKCIWITRAVISIALQPSLECIEKSDIIGCIESVTNNTSDVVIVSPDYVMDATLKYGLTTLYYEISDQEKDGYILSAVVKAHSNIKKLSDLKMKKACFTKVNGIGWNSALKTLNEKNYINSVCQGKNGLVEFFKEVCVFENIGYEDVPLCCNEKKTLNNSKIKILDCLLQDGCDVSFLDKISVDEHEDLINLKDSKGKIFQKVCMDDYSSGCYWSWSYSSYIMINPNTTQVKIQEINSLFFQLGDILGKKSKNDNQIMEIFGSFNEVKNVLFQDTSTNFVKEGNWNSSRNYNSVIDILSLCSKSSYNFKNLFLLLIFPVLLLAKYF